MQAKIMSNCRQWDDFVAASPCCNITQSYAWGDLAPHLGASEALRVGVVDDAGQLCAAMLILVQRAPVLNATYFYAPRGPIIDDPGSPALTVLLNFVRAQARKRDAFMLKVEPRVPTRSPGDEDSCRVVEQITGHTDGDVRWLAALQRHGFRVNPHAMHIRHEWVLDIRPDEKALLAAMKEKWRYNIRLAARKGVTVRRGSGTSDLDTFYRLYETTSERDQFFIHDRSHYEDVMRLYSEGDRAALFLAEYEGQAIAGTIVLYLGRWSWYMYGASSNAHRERMPNHLLQWNGMQWAKSKGCWYYNFRGIPDILEEGQELWGVYVFKRGFGGFAMRSLATHDLVYQPLIYEAYRRLLDVKRWRDERRCRKAAAAQR